MSSWDCKVKKYIAIFSLLIISQSCFGLTKKVLTKKYTKIYNTAKIPDLYSFFPAKYSNLADLYIPEIDSASWFDDALLAAEEERIASEISDMDNTADEYHFENFDLKEAYFLNKDSTIRQVTLDKEIFMIQKREDSFIATHVNEYQIERIFYDLKFRNIKTEIWNTTATENKKNTIYEYSGDESIYPSKKTIEKFDVNPNQKEIIIYNSENQPGNSKIYVLISEKNKNNVESIRQELINSQNWEYDSKNRVIKNCQKVYSYADNTYKKQTDVFEKKYIYLYHESNLEEEFIPADTEYFENNVLKMRLTFKTKLDYIKQYFFEDDYNVTSYYENDKLVKEIYKIGNKIVRTKNYDN